MPLIPSPPFPHPPPIPSLGHDCLRRHHRQGLAHAAAVAALLAGGCTRVLAVMLRFTPCLRAPLAQCQRWQGFAHPAALAALLAAGATQQHDCRTTAVDQRPHPRLHHSVSGARCVLSTRSPSSLYGVCLALGCAAVDPLLPPPSPQVPLYAFNQQLVIHTFKVRGFLVHMYKQEMCISGLPQNPDAQPNTRAPLPLLTHRPWTWAAPSSSTCSVPTTAWPHRS